MPVQLAKLADSTFNQKLPEEFTGPEKWLETGGIQCLV
jgi:hypothetical protein